MCVSTDVLSLSTGCALLFALPFIQIPSFLFTSSLVLPKFLMLVWDLLSLAHPMSHDLEPFLIPYLSMCLCLLRDETDVMLIVANEVVTLCCFRHIFMYYYYSFSRC